MRAVQREPVDEPGAPPIDGQVPGEGRNLLMRGIRGYQLARAGRPTGCRYIPTCSEYAIEAIRCHGAVRGSWMALRRVLRCNPWGRYGFDPVPEGGRSCSDR